MAIKYVIKVDKNLLQNFINIALSEDVGDGDHTSLATIPANAKGKAKLLVKEAGILAGVELALQIFETVDPELQVETLMQDGDPIKPGDIAFFVEGAVRSILTAERLVLNCMQRMSGIATKTHKITELIKGSGVKLLDTRKTTPGIRYLEKWAVRIGGGVNHRFGLYDMILIKDNHVDYAGGIKQALKTARNYLTEKHKDLQIEIEVRNLQELQQVIDEGGADRILLDNFTVDGLKEAVSLVKGRFITEASGGIDLNNIAEYATTGVDYISSGALTHSVKSLDLSLKAV